MITLILVIMYLGGLYIADYVQEIQQMGAVLDLPVGADLIAKYSDL